MEDKKEILSMQRHSMSHVLAKAICSIYEGVKLTIGPAVDNGFYYDFDIPVNITQDKFAEIEAKMDEIIKSNQDFKRVVVSKEKALEMFKDNEYKTELINELPDSEEISVYYLGDDFYDLCRGPHVENTKFLRSFAYKINKVNGAYWRGSEKNKMLQRVYCYGFENKQDLKSYIQAVEDAIRRDHNKIGRELEYFTTVPYIGQGLPILLPKGARVVQLLQRFVEDEEQKRGYLLTKTPFMAKSDLYKISGHWQHYREGMFILGDPEKDKEVFALRPMTCPFQFQVYLNKPRSYKDLPMRLNETSTLFRNEDSGEMHGLIRVRQFTISEGHLACRPDQLEEEFKGCLDLATYMLKSIGLDGDVSYRFSKWDENNKEKYIGSAEEWENVQNVMRNILNDLNLEYTEEEGEAAFYGPKLDIQIKNVYGKEDTLITIQVDFQLAQRFGMEYTDSDGAKKFPYVIHRTSLGCYERTLALLLEKYAGAMPTWIAPEQVRIMTITEKNDEFALKVKSILQQNGVRVEADLRNESIGRKIKDAVNNKIPYMLVIGDNEQENNSVAIRKRGKGDIGSKSVDEFVSLILSDINNKVLD